MTSNPYLIEWENGSKIIGFTTGAASGNAAASIRGQRADYIYLDEMDYLGDGDYDTVAMIAGERDDIGMFVSSTPTGKRSKFYECCTNKALGYTEHYHPSMHNPNWGDRMEAEFRAQLTELGYIHEVLADFGPQETGVFDKDKIELAIDQECYAYEKLTYAQSIIAESKRMVPNMYLFGNGVRCYPNKFRTMGVDWDKYGASSSIIILDFDVNNKKFKVIRRVEVPRGEYSYDNAVNMIVELNDIYDPSWIYCDRGSGEYQIERLHIIGDQNLHTGLKNKVKGFQFKQKIPVTNPVSKTVTQESLKPFMVNQLCISFERNRMMLSPFDEVLKKQLIDYEVIKKSQSGEPIYTDKNEHYVDALGLAHLAFVLEFPDLTQTIQLPEYSSKIYHSTNNAMTAQSNAVLKELSSPIINPWSKINNKQDDDRPGDKQRWYKVDSHKNSLSSSTNNWGRRDGAFERSKW